MPNTYYISKSRPTLRDVHPSQQALTNISIAFRNEQYIYSQVFPIVPVQKKDDYYFVYQQEAFFRNRSGMRAPGTEAPRANFGISTASYICINDSIMYEIPDEVRNNADAPLAPDVDAAEFVSDQLELGAEIRVADLITASANWGYTGGSPTAAWSNPSSSPFGDIMAAINSVVSKIGRRPNVGVCSWDVWRFLVDHPDFLERIKYTRPGARLQQGDMTSWFELDRFLIGTALKDTSEEGQTASPVYVWGDGLWVGYVPPNPSLRTPAAGYLFRWGNKSINRYRKDTRHMDLIEGEWWTDEVISASVAGAYIPNAV